MKRLVFALGALALGFVATTPAARADFAVMKFESGYCRIWLPGPAMPMDKGGKMVAQKLPDLSKAMAALNTARARKVCK